jgi:Fe-S cluster assembly iron-binding protein IscA
MIEQQPTVTEPTLPGTVVSLTDAAVTKLQELTKEETNPDIGLRVYVYSGGCSGFRYGMMLEDQPTPRTTSSMPAASRSTSTARVSRSSRARRSTTSTR